MKNDWQREKATLELKVDTRAREVQLHQESIDRKNQEVSSSPRSLIKPQNHVCGLKLCLPIKVLIDIGHSHHIMFASWMATERCTMQVFIITYSRCNIRPTLFKTRLKPVRNLSECISNFN